MLNEMGPCKVFVQGAAAIDGRCQMHLSIGASDAEALRIGIKITNRPVRKEVIEEELAISPDHVGRFHREPVTLLMNCRVAVPDVRKFGDRMIGGSDPHQIEGRKGAQIRNHLKENHFGSLQYG